MSLETQASVYLKTEEIYSNREDSPFASHGRSKVAASIGDAGRIGSIRVSKKTNSRTETEKIKTEYKYGLISSDHGRSMTESATSKSVIWRGKLPGDIYGAVSLKGTAMYKGLNIEPGGIADYEVQGRGLMDDACIDRCIRVSEVLRANGLPTEKPVSVMLLKEVIQKKGLRSWEKISISKWKKIKLDELEGDRWKKDVDRYFSETNFASLERHIQVDERVRDLGYAKGIKAIQDFLGPVFNWLNVATSYTKNSLISGTKQPDRFNTSRESMILYLSDFLPSQIGTYLGRLHKLGIVHRYPHDQNWSMVGTLYDLDSPSGKPIFTSDGKPEYRQYAQDFYFTAHHIGNIIADAVWELGHENIYSLQNASRAVIARSYIRERYGSLNPITKHVFKNIYNNYAGAGNLYVMENVWNLI